MWSQFLKVRKYMYLAEFQSSTDYISSHNNIHSEKDVRWMTIYYMSDGCDVTAHHYWENCQFPPRGHLAGWCIVYQTCPPYIKPVRPYLNPRGAEVRAIWRINRASVLHTIYQVLVTLRLTVYGENSPVSAAVRRRPFWRLICHYNKLARNT